MMVVLPLPLLLLLSLLATIITSLYHHGASRPTRNLIDEQIIQALEALREHMAGGWPELGIPPLDPLTLHQLDINMTSNGTSVLGNVTEVSMTGLSSFTIDLVHTNLLFLKVDLDLGLASLDVAGKYHLLGQTGVFPIYGHGPLWLDAFNLSLMIRMDLGQTPDGLLGVSSLDINIDCNSTDIRLEGIMGGGDMADFVNGVLSSLGPDLLEALEQQYVPLLEEALIHEINNIINGGGRLPLATCPSPIPLAECFASCGSEHTSECWQHTRRYSNIPGRPEGIMSSLYRPVHFKEKGAGPLDTPLYNLVTNTLLGELTSLVSTSVEGIICNLLENAIASSG
ncbi:uncharacterized protein [Panulirus ornatus]|uniref:uncharacterized protein n=1 Tax=Panulirus ornatus TaxID=150431 RepID=UPI003A8BA8D1